MTIVKTQSAAEASAASDLSPALTQRLADYLKAASGQTVDVGKLYLIESKLKPLMRREGLTSFKALIDSVERNRRSRLADAVTQAMTINETHFFRDGAPFDVFRAALPEFKRRATQDRTLRIWSAACSTGQEIYSIAMVIEELSSLFAGWRIELVGTDISEAVIHKAASGIYSQFEVQRGLPAPLLPKYFERSGDDCSVVERIRKRVRFQKLNLLEDFTSLGRFNFVFCRNVLFYFEQSTRAQILDRIAGILQPEGLLVLGTSEALSGLASGFRPKDPGSCLLRYNGGSAAPPSSATVAPTRCAAPR